MSDLSISFADDAAETFQNLLDNFKGYGVTITPQEGEPYEAVLVGPDLGDQWYDKVIAYEVKDGEYLTLDEFRARGDVARHDRVVDIEIS